MSKLIRSIISLDNILTRYFLEVYDIKVETHFPIPEKFCPSFFFQKIFKVFSKNKECYQLVMKVNGPSCSQGVYSDMYMTGGLGPGIFWDTQKINTRKNQTQKNKFMKITDPKK